MRPEHFEWPQNIKKTEAENEGYIAKFYTTQDDPTVNLDEIRKNIFKKTTAKTPNSLTISKSLGLNPLKMTEAGFSENIMKNFKVFGWKELNDIQQHSVKAIQNNQNLIITAPKRKE